MFRIHARWSPALVDRMIIDWFHPWLDDTLYSIAMSSLSDVGLDENDPEVAIQFIANADLRVIQMSGDYLETELRSNYATPKWLLELISLFKAMLEKIGPTITNNSQHFSNGLKTLQDLSQDVEVTKKQAKIVAKKQAECAALIDRISQDAAIVKKESEATQREDQNRTRKAASICEGRPEESTTTERTGA
jgi:hypothetical protein